MSERGLLRAVIDTLPEADAPKRRRSVRLLEECSRQSRLPDDRQEGPDADLAMVGYWDGRGRAAGLPLHHTVATTLPGLRESVTGEDLTYLRAGQNP
jgi:hypothetical protein